MEFDAQITKLVKYSGNTYAIKYMQKYTGFHNYVIWNCFLKSGRAVPGIIGENLISLLRYITNPSSLKYLDNIIIL